MLGLVGPLSPPHEWPVVDIKDGLGAVLLGAQVLGDQDLPYN